MELYISAPPFRPLPSLPISILFLPLSSPSLPLLLEVVPVNPAKGPWGML